MSSLNDPRVLFATERTLLAWNRTSISMMVFGFVVERAGLLLGLIAPERTSSLKEELFFWLGLSFIALGVAVALYASRQFALVLKTLTPEEFPEGYKARWGLVVNWVVALLGLGLIAALSLD